MRTKIPPTSLLGCFLGSWMLQIHVATTGDGVGNAGPDLCPHCALCQMAAPIGKVNFSACLLGGCLIDVCTLVMLSLFCKSHF